MYDINELLSIDAQTWRNAFRDMETRAKVQADSMKGPFIFHGEIDDPSEMLQYPTVTLEQVQSAGKTNWIENLDHEFFAVGDATMEELFDADKVLHSRIETEPSEYDLLASIEAKIRYRVEHQHITERQAKELVGYECEESLFKNTYIFEVSETFDNSDTGLTRTQTYTESIQADTEEEARNELMNNLWPVGFVFCDGYNYLKHCRYTESVLDHSINLVEVVPNT